MKKCLAFLLTVLLLLGAAGAALTAQAAETVVLASRASLPSIVLPRGATAAQRNAAQLLREYLQKITGAADGAAASACCVYLDSPEVRPASQTDGAYRIEVRDGDLYLSGAGSHGTLYGVFALLEDVCKCRWYAYDLEIVPASQTVTLPAGYTADYAPYFEYRETDWRSYVDPRYAAANRMNGCAYRDNGAAWGSPVRYLSGFAHTLTNVFCRADSYFDAHPEYFALHKGARTPKQLCLTHPDVLRIVTDEVLSLLRRTYDPDGGLQIVSLTQNDNQDYCECAECKAIDDANGSHAGTMITFANAVADAVQAAGFENVAVDTFAYQYTRKPPTKVVPRGNVIVRLCSIECCFGHTFDDPQCKENEKFMDDLRGWSAICDRIYVWDYGVNYGESFSFFPNFRVLQRNMQIFYENHVRGVYGEGNYYVDRCDGEFSDLRCYLQCRLAADPYLDYDEEMNGFLRAFYGDGWQAIREFIDLCCDKGVTKNYHAGIFRRDKGSLPGLRASDVRKCETLWQTSLDGAKTDAERQRVQRSMLCWRYWKASNGKLEFSLLRSPFKRMQARDELYRDIVSSGADCIGETLRKRELSDCPALHLLRIPFCWSTLYDNAFWDAVSPAVEKLYDWYLRTFENG